MRIRSARDPQSTSGIPAHADGGGKRNSVTASTAPRYFESRIPDITEDELGGNPGMGAAIVPTECMTVAQVADDLGCSKQMVYAYARRDGLPLRTRRGYQRGKYVVRREYEAWKTEVYHLEPITTVGTTGGIER